MSLGTMIPEVVSARALQLTKQKGFWCSESCDGRGTAGAISEGAELTVSSIYQIVESVVVAIERHLVISLLQSTQQPLRKRRLRGSFLLRQSFSHRAHLVI